MATTRERKRTLAAAVAALHHHALVAAASAPGGVPRSAAPVPKPAASAWTFAGRQEMMNQRVRRQMRRGG